jgi:hypothetical protein
VTRISSGWTSSVPGNQLAALFSQGIGLTPSNSKPSFHLPPGTPPVSAFLISSSPDGSWMGGGSAKAELTINDAIKIDVTKLLILLTNEVIITFLMLWRLKAKLEWG